MSVSQVSTHLPHTSPGGGGAEDVFIDSVVRGRRGRGSKHHQRHGHSLNKREQILDLSGFVTTLVEKEWEVSKIRLPACMRL